MNKEEDIRDYRWVVIDSSGETWYDNFHQALNHKSEGPSKTCSEHVYPLIKNSLPT